MNISDNGVTLIKSFEGFSSMPSPDPINISTIGYGHKMLFGESFPKGINEAEASTLLKTDLMPVESTIDSLVTASLTQNQFDALCSFTYNVGCWAFRKSHLLTYLNADDYEAAADQFLRWNHADGKVVDGLTKRRESERNLFLS